MDMVYIHIQMEIFMKVFGIKISRQVSFYNKNDLGQGVYKFKNGSLYMGWFKNGQPHGEGTLEYNVT